MTAGSKHWAQTKERGGELGIRSLIFIYRLFGKRVFKVIFIPVMLYFFITGVTARRAIYQYWRNLESSLQWPACNAIRLRMHSFKVFLSFGFAIVDKFDAWLDKISLDDLEIDDPDSYHSLATAEGKVILSTHLGNMEVCRAIFGRGAAQKRINVITYTEHAQSFNKVLKSINPDSELTFIHIGQFGPQDAILLQEKVDAGEVVIIFADRTSVTNPDKVYWSEFLGKPAPFGVGPVLLASLMECPVYFMTCLKQPETGRYRMYLKQLAEGGSLSRKQRKEYQVELLRQYAATLSHYCQIAPHQWFNFYDFWQADNAQRAGVNNNGVRANGTKPQ